MGPILKTSNLDKLLLRELELFSLRLGFSLPRLIGFSLPTLTRIWKRIR